MSWKVAAGLALSLALVVLLARLAQDGATGTATWDASRAAGFASYLLLWISVVTGVGLHLRFRVATFRMTWMLEAHRITSVLALSFAAAHVFALLLDPVVPFSVLDGLVPFTSSYRAGQVGLGTIAQWLLVVVLATTGFAGSIPWGTWRKLHLLSFPCYVLALGHGITSGSDSGAAWSLVIYSSTSAIFAACCVARFFGRDWTPAEV